MWIYENQARQNGYIRISGVDEVGRGPLAGPVVAASVIIPYGCNIPDVNDSKLLTPKKRNALYKIIYNEAIAIGIGIVDSWEIDRINILKAAQLAMAISVAHLDPTPDFVLVDGNYPIPISIPQEAIIKGDSQSFSIASASIVAKVTRDRLMIQYDSEYPQYGFLQHKGYPTEAHKKMIRKYGLSPIHRKTFQIDKKHKQLKRKTE
ncbi:MAG: ribonuclease HII [Desulfobacterales bacterium]|nr:ribonuclease HII [Desulfobacterales bacterium]